MADVKWIKITTNIFDDEKFDAIDTQADKQMMQLAWIKLLCLAGRCNENGFLMLSNEIPYTDEMIANRFNMSIGDVQRALGMFQYLNMIEVVNDVYMVSNWSKYQNQPELERIKDQNRKRQQKFRDNQKKMISQNQCQYCGGVATGYDHVIPLSRGGSDTEDNKVFCCKECNNKKTTLPLADFLNFNRDVIKDDIVLSNPVLRKHIELVDGKYRNVTNALQNNVICSYSISSSLSNSKDIEVIKEIIDYLNSKTNKNFNYKTKESQKHIIARLKEGYTVEDFKKVIDNKTADWLKDSKMNKYLQPSTLFAPSHFDEYLNQEPKNSLNNGFELKV